MIILNFQGYKYTKEFNNAVSQLTLKRPVDAEYKCTYF